MFGYARIVRLAVVTMLAVVAMLPTGCGLIGGNDDLDGTQWRLAEWSVSSLDAREFAITVSFEGDQMGGQAPVNSYGGTYSTGRGGAFSAQEIAQTLMAGSEPAMRAEAAYFQLLSDATLYEVDGGQLTLSTAEGAEVLVFEKATQ